MNEFSKIQSRADLARVLKIPLKKLTYILYVKKIDDSYTSFIIPKKRGGVRSINAPNRELKAVQRNLSNALMISERESMKNKSQKSISHGFVKGKGIITNAEIHRNKRFVLNLDIEDFFDSFHFGRIRGYFHKNKNYQLPIEIATIIAQLSCYNRKLPQGAPSSPIITNLICNILDMHLYKVAKYYNANYTRYVDDLTFSSNDNIFRDYNENFISEIKKEIELFGFKINNKKTRLQYSNSRQEVTGLLVNKKLNVLRDYYKITRSMANHLYKNGEFEISGKAGTIKQLEGRFAYINQLDHYNNCRNKEKHSFFVLNSREREYQKFLFYKYFYSNENPLIVTEGKTDVVYLKSALKKYYLEYPDLIQKHKNNFAFNISFLNKSARLEYFLNISPDGAAAMKNIYNLYIDKNNSPNLNGFFLNKTNANPVNPVILIFDNEQETKRPLKDFTNHVKSKYLPLSNDTLSVNIISNLYVLTNPLVNGMSECEIEDLFDDDILATSISGKLFSKEKIFNTKTHYGKNDFSNYISNNYEKIDFHNFKPMLDELNQIIKSSKIIRTQNHT